MTKMAVTTFDPPSQKPDAAHQLYGSIFYRTRVPKLLCCQSNFYTAGTGIFCIFSCDLDLDTMTFLHIQT